MFPRLTSTQMEVGRNKKKDFLPLQRALRENGRGFLQEVGLLFIASSASRAPQSLLPRSFSLSLLFTVPLFLSLALSVSLVFSLFALLS